jgi:multidrug resistance efflux pump
MDRVKPQTNRRSLSRLAWLGGAVLMVGCVGVALAFTDFSTARVDPANLTISTVEQGTLEVKVRGSGQLLPKNVEYLGAQVSGRVVKKLVQPGDVVKAGQVMLELANPKLVVTSEEAASAWEGAVTELRATESELKTDLLNQEIALTQAKFALQSAQLQMQAESELKEANLVPDVQFQRTKLSVVQLKQALDIGQDRVNAIRANIKMQVAVKQAKVTELGRALERAKGDVRNLQIVAGIDGIVQAFKLNIGQELAAGESLGRIAQSGLLYAELKVPAGDASDVQIGQPVVVDTHNGVVNGVVTRVDPAITEGTVVVDVGLKDALPAGARPQLAVDGDIYLVRLPNTVFVRKPSYAQNNASVPVYKVDASGKYADKLVVQSGKLSLTTMQVLRGLKAGDRIITSEAGDWQGKDRIRIR